MKENQKEDYKWFISNYDLMYKKYGEGYFAIRNKEILGIYESFKSAFENTLRQYKVGEFIIQFCNGDESGYTVYVL